MSLWVPARGGRRQLRPGRCGRPPLGLSAGRTCRRTPRRSHRPTLCCRPHCSRLCRRLQRPSPLCRAGTRGQHERSGSRLGLCERPRLASRHNAGQHGQRLVSLCRISRLVPLEVVQQVLGVEVGRPAVLAGFPCAVTSPIQPTPGADVDRLRSTLLRGQVAAEVLQHVPNFGIAAILTWGASLGWQLERFLWGWLCRSVRGCRRPNGRHAWWLRQLQHPPPRETAPPPSGAKRRRTFPGRP